MERTNKIFVVGTLLQVRDVRRGEKDGVKWIGGTAVVKSGDSEIEFKYFSSEKTKAGKDNSRYPNYDGLEDRVGERVRVNGEISGRLWYNDSQNQVINFNEATAGFFNSAKPSDQDTATFEFGGFVVKPLHERLNKDEELIAYEMEIGQANYNGDNMHIVRFTVDKDSKNIINAVETAYTKGTTVYINGSIVYEVVVEERTEDVAFGDPITKKFQSTRKSFLITGGKQPIIEDGIAYSAEDIAKLESAYKLYIADLEKKAKERNASSGGTGSNGPAVSDNTDRLL